MIAFEFSSCAQHQSVRRPIDIAPLRQKDMPDGDGAQ
jgi:hypothetical protein